MNKQVDKYIDEHKNEMISFLQELLHIPSVEGKPEDGAPFGIEVKRALDFALSGAEKMGLKTENMEGYAGCIDYGEGDELLAILCHLDVVPEDTGWKYPPYSATIEDGKIYARGALDDKGPAVSSMYALYAIKELGLKTKRRIRIILGTNEETGWGCMQYYKKHGEMPHIAFSPDGDYPLVNSEKGIIHATFARKFDSEVVFNSGSAANKVPHIAEIKVKIPYDVVNDIVSSNKELLKKYPVEVKAEGEYTSITVKGKSAHAAMNDLGINALVAGLDILSQLPISGEDKKIATLLHEKLMYDLNGEHLGLDFTDESGRQTVNPGVLKWDISGISCFTLDLRCPTSKKLTDIFKHLEEVFGTVGLKAEGEQELKDGLFVPRDSELVETLLNVYNTRMGTNLEPLAIGGGTYARAFKNAVAFGCEKPGAESTVHMANEFIHVDDMVLNAKMIADAIIALACK